jgi:hypothetical protein
LGDHDSIVLGRRMFIDEACVVAAAGAGMVVASSPGLTSRLESCGGRHQPLCTQGAGHWQDNTMVITAAPESETPGSDRSGQLT